MSSDRKLVLHIGLDKTGTTTIQNVLHANREYLLTEECFLYPSLMPNLSTPLLTMFKSDPFRHRANRMAGLPNEEVAKRQRQHLSSLDAEISSHEWETLLLSAEGLSSLREHEVAKLREWIEQYSVNWTVLVCVRHPVAWARSVIQERLKQGDALQQLYETPPIPKYRQKISNAMSVFGRENVRVFDFETATANPSGIVGAFAGQAGLSSSSSHFLASQAVRANEALSLEAAHILDSLNRQLPVFIDDARATRRPGAKHILPYISRIKGSQFDVPYSVKEKIRLRSLEDVEWLNETFSLALYREVADFGPVAESPGRGREERDEGPVGAVDAQSDPTIDSTAEVLGELITAYAFQHSLKQGRAALARGNLGRAESMLTEAAWLDPDALQPQKLLKEVTEKRQST